ncbi:unnamed protein product [Protopolystoma xenopodis]|uniref:Uncharacterized protein n=1 Tax=Protopolystoma xenopodis TaxID=117903 RepID=A0A3S5CSA9_9PLAT|nr:unnamed protein product [Protopolystoma xenopodis]
MQVVSVVNTSTVSSCRGKWKEPVGFRGQLQPIRRLQAHRLSSDAANPRAEFGDAGRLAISIKSTDPFISDCLLHRMSGLFCLLALAVFPGCLGGRLTPYERSYGYCT